MVSGNEAVESFFNSINAVKAPIELSIQKVAKDVEHCLYGNKNWINNGVKFSLGNKDSKLQLKRKNVQYVVSDDRKEDLFIMVPVKDFLGMFSLNCGNKLEVSKRVEVREDESCVNCLQFAVTSSVLVGSFFQNFTKSIKVGKKRAHKKNNENMKRSWESSCSEAQNLRVSCEIKEREVKGHFFGTYRDSDAKRDVVKIMPFKCLMEFIFDQLAKNIQKFNQGVHGSDQQSCDVSSHNGHVTAIEGIADGIKVDVDGFLRNLRFAKVGGVASTMVEVASVKEGGEDGAPAGKQEETGSNSSQIADEIFNIPSSDVERLRSTLSTVLTELVELPQLGRTSQDHPDKKKLFSVQDFFTYTESEGRRFFEELDRDGDGQVTLEDLEVATRKRKLPREYAREFLRHTRRHIFSKSFGWKQFLSFMDQKEPTILRVYTSLGLSKAGTLQKSEILASLKNAGLPANEGNAVAMMQFLNGDTEESISYGHFRNFMLLLPSNRLRDDPRNVRFEAASVVAVAPPVEIPAGSILKSALAGGLSCAFSCFMMHPIDTIKANYYFFL